MMGDHVLPAGLRGRPPIPPRAHSGPTAHGLEIGLLRARHAQAQPPPQALVVGDPLACPAVPLSSPRTVPSTSRAGRNRGPEDAEGRCVRAPVESSRGGTCEATKLPELLSCPRSTGPSPLMPGSAPSSRLCSQTSSSSLRPQVSPPSSAQLPVRLLTSRTHRGAPGSSQGGRHRAGASVCSGSEQKCFR